MCAANKNNRETSSSFLKRNQLGIFFIVTLFLSAGLALVAKVIGDKNITFLIVLTPTLTAIALTMIFGGKEELRELLIRKTIQGVEIRWIVISLVTFPLIAATAILIHSLFGGPALTLRTTKLMPQMIVILLVAFGEEYGWRGFALPKLQQRHSALVASLILGSLWGCWHFPGYLVGVGVPLEMPFYVFLLWVFAATILITWVFNNTQSVMMAVVMHATANAAFNYLSLLPEFTGQITTFYLFLGLTWLVTIFVIIAFSRQLFSRIKILDRRF